MLVTEVLQKCDKDMSICVDLDKNTATQVVEKYLELNNIKDISIPQLLAIEFGFMQDVEQSGSVRDIILAEAQTIMRNNSVYYLSTFIERYNGSIDCFEGLEVSLFSQNNQKQLVIHTK